MRSRWVREVCVLHTQSLRALQSGRLRKLLQSLRRRWFLHPPGLHLVMVLPEKQQAAERIRETKGGGAPSRCPSPGAPSGRKPGPAAAAAHASPMGCPAQGRPVALGQPGNRGGEGAKAWAGRARPVQLGAPQGRAGPPSCLPCGCSPLLHSPLLCSPLLCSPLLRSCLLTPRPLPASQPPPRNRLLRNPTCRTHLPVPQSRAKRLSETSISF